MYRCVTIFAISFCLASALFAGCGAAETVSPSPLQDASADGPVAADSSIGEGQ